MPLSMVDWHKRFQEQAGWTVQIQKRFFEITRFSGNLKILDTGSGTGALFPNFMMESIDSPFGVDIHLPSLEFAKKNNPSALLVQADGFSLPFKPGSFDIALCHFTLLWVDNPLQFIAEMIRTVKNNGWVAALGEPDHSSRLDYPDDLVELGAAQTQSLIDQGADIIMGRKLAGIFARSGLTDITVGILGAEWKPFNPINQGEWDVLQNDLEKSATSQDIKTILKAEESTRKNGSRVLFVPTFYAWGKVP
jgi:SAM-dependent methyltransferase